MALLGGGAGREFVLKIIADVKDATKGVDEVAAKTTSMKDKMIGVGKGVAAGLAVGAIVQFGKSAVDAAANADDAADAINAAFGSASEGVAQFSKSAAENMGLSTTAYQEMAAKTGNLLQSVGISNEDAAKSTELLSQRAADMAAIWGGDTTQAMEAINKAMVGSTKGLTQFGVKISAAEIDARAMAKGYVDASGKVTDAGKAIAAQELILEKTSNVQGEWAKNSKDLGSQQAIMQAKFQNLQTTLGEKLLPIIVKLMELFAPIMDFITKNIQWIGPLAAGILAIVAALKVWTVVQTALNIVLTANPIGIIIVAIAALVAGVILLYTKVGWFRDMVDGAVDAIVAGFTWVLDIIKSVYTWVSDNWPLLVAIITGPIGIAVALIVKNWDTIKEAFSAAIGFIKQTVSTVFDILTAPFRRTIDAVKAIINEIPALFRTISGAINSALSGLAEIITYPFREGWRLAKAAGETVMTWFGQIKGHISSLFVGLADVVTSPFRTAFNAIKTLWNSTVGGFGFTVPSWVPGIGGKGWKIPMMDQGGIVTRPTIALIGERRPEAVIPLDQLATMGGGGGGTTTIIELNVYALDATAQTGRRIYDSLREYARVSGGQLVIP